MYAMEFESLCVSEANGPLHVFLSSFGITKSLEWLLEKPYQDRKKQMPAIPALKKAGELKI